MDEQFAHDSGRQLLNELATALRDKRVYRRNQVHIAFVCGGPVGPDADTMRSQFLAWAASRLPNFIIVLAESAYKNTVFIDPPEALNLATFESIIAEVSDCVILFPESYGSFAEIGFFSGSSRVRPKTLVVNDFEFQAKESFANLGPIARCDTDHKAYLRPTILVKGVDGLVDFSPVEERLARLSERSNRIRIRHAPYKELTYAQKLVLVLVITQILAPITLSSLYVAVKTALDGCSTKDLKQLLSILVAAGYVERRDEYFVADLTRPSLTECEGFSPEELRARTLSYYQKHHPHLLPKSEPWR